jgi:hypothetical protein
LPDTGARFRLNQQTRHGIAERDYRARVAAEVERTGDRLPGKRGQTPFPTRQRLLSSHSRTRLKSLFFP